MGAFRGRLWLQRVTSAVGHLRLLEGGEDGDTVEDSVGTLRGRGHQGACGFGANRAGQRVEQTQRLLLQQSSCQGGATHLHRFEVVHQGGMEDQAQLGLGLGPPALLHGTAINMAQRNRQPEM